MSLPPVEIPLGAMRFNSDSQKLEYWNGDIWMQVHTFSPNLDGGVRAIAAGGSGPSGNPDKVQYFSMASSGNASDFGNLPQRQYLTSGTASRSRAVFMGGYTNSPSSTYINSIQCLEIASTGSASDFGDLTSVAGYTGTVGNQIRSVRMGGTSPSSPWQVTMDYVSIAVKANAVDFGDMSYGTSNSSNINNPIRGINALASAPNSSRTIESITIPTTGNTSDFGLLTHGRQDGSGMSNSVRGIFNGGYESPGLVPFMEHVTIATEGNGTRFGDLSVVTFREGGHASPTRGIISGGMGPSPYPYLDTMQSVNFASEGDTVDFGDLDASRIEHASTSNGHGGLG